MRLSEGMKTSEIAGEYMIRHNESGSILFMGRVVNPVDAE